MLENIKQFMQLVDAETMHGLILLALSAYGFLGCVVCDSSDDLADVSGSLYLALVLLWPVAVLIRGAYSLIRGVAKIVKRIKGTFHTKDKEDRRREKENAKKAVNTQNEILKIEKKLEAKNDNAQIDAIVNVLEEEAQTISNYQIKNAVLATCRKLQSLKETDVRLSGKAVRYFKEYIGVLHNYNEGIDNINVGLQNEFTDVRDKIYNLTYRMCDVIDNEVVSYYKGKGNMNLEINALDEIITAQINSRNNELKLNLPSD